MFDPEEAGRALTFFEQYLVHIKGAAAGKAFQLERWQRAIVGNLFGWKRPDGTRRYREALIFIPRKNGKSFLAAGICNFLLFCDAEPGAEIYCAAAERGQAALVFEVARQQVLRNTELSKVAQVFQHAIVIEKSASFIRPISADANTKHGFNSHGTIVDELHVQPNRDLVDVLMTSTGARRQPLTVHLTTSDYERESICNEKHDYASKVRDGVIEDSSFLPVIYEAARDDDWTSPDTWRKANPNLGVSISEEYLERECHRAQQTPTFENTFKRLHLNIRTEQDVRWLPIEKWDACAAGLDVEDLAGQECYAGLDLSTTRDVTALSLVFPRGSRYAVLPFFWVPEESAHERERKDRVPYITWARQELLELTPGNVVDYDRVRAKINELGQKYRILKIAVDRWNATQISTQLQGDGFSVELYGQGYASMSGPSKELEKLIMGKQISHGGNPVLRWMASNVTVELDAAGNVKPSKAASTEKIDGIVATIMALGQAMQRKGGSVYDTRGLKFL